MGFRGGRAGTARLCTGAKGTLDLVSTKDVCHITPSHTEVEHDDVWSALDEFSMRWNDGLDNLLEDVEAAADVVANALGIYAQFGDSALERLALGGADGWGFDF